MLDHATPKRRTRVKFCGLTRAEDVDAAVAWEPMPGIRALARQPASIDLERLASLAARVPAFVTRVGLFVDPDTALVERAAEHLDLLQFHGDESSACCASFGRPWIKALRMRDGLDLETAARDHAGARALLLDAIVPGCPVEPARPSIGRESPQPWQNLLSSPEASRRPMWPRPSRRWRPSRWMFPAVSRLRPDARTSMP